MKFNITARHIELTPALREYAEKRVGQVRKYSRQVTNAHVVLNVEKDRHIAEVTIGVSKNKINAKAIAGDMYAALDIVMDKVNKQLKKHVDKMKNHKISQSYSEMADMVWHDLEDNEIQLPIPEPELREIRELKIKQQTVRQALETIESRDLNFWIFKDVKEDSINIIFKKEDGTNGMIIVR
ncbi:MAG: ribosome-associated translation inhibitor RaiA [Elusimicrobiota bacterium]